MTFVFDNYKLYIKNLLIRRDGVYRVRTGDLNNAIVALYQLS